MLGLVESDFGGAPSSYSEKVGCATSAADIMVRWDLECRIR
jgi:hypothetical protein